MEIEYAFSCPYCGQTVTMLLDLRGRVGDVGGDGGVIVVVDLVGVEHHLSGLDFCHASEMPPRTIGLL